MGDFENLPPGGLRALLKSFGSPDSFGNPPAPRTGSIHVVEESGRAGDIFFKAGRVYAIHYSGFTPPLARRLLTNDAISAEEYSRLSETDSPDNEETILTTTDVDQEILENINRQMMLSSLTFLYSWDNPQWEWAEGVATEVNTVSPLEPGLLVAATDERQGQWKALERSYPDVTSSDAIPTQGSAWVAALPEDAHPESKAVHGLVNGENPNRFIAGMIGLTRFELAGRLAQLLANDVVAYEGGALKPSSEQMAMLVELQQERNELLHHLDSIDRQIAALSGDGDTGFDT